MNGRKARANTREITLAIIIRTMLKRTKNDQRRMERMFIMHTIKVSLESHA